MRMAVQTINMKGKIGFELGGTRSKLNKSPFKRLRAPRSEPSAFPQSTPSGFAQQTHCPVLQAGGS